MVDPGPLFYPLAILLRLTPATLLGLALLTLFGWREWGRLADRHGRLLLAIGTPGSYGIPQTIAQMLVNVLDFDLNVQAAIEAPRLRLGETAGLGVMIERRVTSATIADLAARGHELQVIGDWDILVGGGHGVAIDPATGLITGGADPRRDGAAFGLP